MAELSTLGSVIKTAYEAESDTNAFTDTEKTKLTNIEALADVTDTANVTAAGALMDSEVTNLAAVKAFDPADYATAAQGTTADSALQDVVSDTTPQLGGSLDVNGNKIVSASNGNIDIEPNGTGNVLLGNFTFDADQTVGAGQDNYVLTYDNGTGLISLEAAAGGGSGDFLADGTVDMTGQFKTDVGTFASDVADGASAVGFLFNTTNAYSTSGAKIASFKNNSVEKAYIDKDGTVVGSASATFGVSNTNSGTRSLVVGFSNNISTSNSSDSIVVGQSNTLTNPDMMVIVGTGHSVIDATYNTNGAVFGSKAKPFSQCSMFIGAGGSSAGDQQAAVIAAFASTADATPTAMNAGGQGISVPADTTIGFSVIVAGRSNEADGNDSAVYKIEGCISRDESNNTALVGSITKTVIAESAGATAWDATCVANDTSELLEVQVTGEAGTTIKWSAAVTLSSVTLA